MSFDSHLKHARHTQFDKSCTATQMILGRKIGAYDRTTYPSVQDTSMLEIFAAAVVRRKHLKVSPSKHRKPVNTRTIITATDNRNHPPSTELGVTVVTRCIFRRTCSAVVLTRGYGIFGLFMPL